MMAPLRGGNDWATSMKPMDGMCAERVSIATRRSPVALGSGTLTSPSRTSRRSVRRSRRVLKLASPDPHHELAGFFNPKHETQNRVASDRARACGLVVADQYCL